MGGSWDGVIKPFDCIMGAIWKHQRLFVKYWGTIFGRYQRSFGGRVTWLNGAVFEVAPLRKSRVSARLSVTTAPVRASEAFVGEMYGYYSSFMLIECMIGWLREIMDESE